MIKMPLISIPYANTIEELRLSLITELRRLTERLAIDTSDAKGERIQNLAKPVAANDAVNLRALNDALSELKGSSSSATSASTEVHLQDRGGSKRPISTIESPTATGDTRIGRINDLTRFDILVNASYDGTNFNLDDTSKPGVWIAINPDTGTRAFGVSYMTAGANPRTPVLAMYVDFSGRLGIGTMPSYDLDVIGDVNYTGTLTHSGTAVLGDYYTKAEIDAMLGAAHIHTVTLGEHTHTDPQGGTTGGTSLYGYTSTPV